MSNVKMVFDPMTMDFDLAMEGGDLLTEPGIETAVLMSIFTDRRAAEDDELPDPNGSRRGWWGDLAGEDATRRIGSRLWLLERSSNLQSVVIKAKEYLDEALQWLVDDGIAAKVVTDVQALDQQTLAFSVEVHRKDGTVEALKYPYMWSN